MPYTYDYPRPSVSVDVVVFALDKSHKLKLLLIQRANNPYKNYWALPGGFVEMDEDLEHAALRELEEETGVKDLFIEQLYTFGSPKRDPRGRVISIAYYALVNLAEHQIAASSDANNADWFDIDKLPKLAFDHQEIFKMAIYRLRGKVRYQPIGFELLPKKFSLPQLQKLYETILDVELNKRNFRKKILKMGFLIEVGKQKDVAHRPATLYKFDKNKYEELLKASYDIHMRRGVDFEI
ncbi:MAG TPA: NUDIX hydrolase [Saprospiraceae bacterium]|nr:NUDIX hydrolase [Saprospiraceae bacterium]